MIDLKGLELSRRFYFEVGAPVLKARFPEVMSRAASMAQSGQYNYYRLIKRGDVFGARLALGAVLNAALSRVSRL